MDLNAYWVGFNHVKGIGAVRFQKILDFFGDICTAWEAPYEAFLEAGLPSKVVDNLVAFRKNADLEEIWGNIKEQGIEVLPLFSDEYPDRLKEIQQAPPVIYLKGKYQTMDEWAVAIVGTRRVTSYGKRVAQDLASFLAKNDVTIVSGMARGVDGIAHQAAIEAGGRTLAVLGCGVDQIYPPEFRQLAHNIIENGALVSDYAPGTPPEGINFPPRNRIISGFSLATVVVEAGERSGALITSTFAVEQGREVFSVPGNIYSPQSKGTNRLIEDGARPLINFEDILELLNLRQIQTQRFVRGILPENNTEKKLLETLSAEPQHIDTIKLLTGFPIEEISAALTLMELKGMVQRVGGMNYVSIHEGLGEYEV